jgi:lipoate-protein ligase A
MARDQALAEMAEQHQVAVIRFYRWDEPSLSLGYFQKESQRPKQFESLPIVRRSTGGGAIIHDCELTYSVMMPTDQSKGHINELYETVHKSIIGWLRDLGLPAEFVRDQKAEGMACECDPNSFLCFDRRADNDVVIRQSKILGSAQRRIGSTILQHGSLLMQASRETPHLKGLVDLLGTSLASEGEIEFANQNSETTGQRDRELSVLATKTIAEAVCADFGISEIHATEWSTDSAARTIAESRFANPEWTSRR